jgi:hypothetical protein
MRRIEAHHRGTEDTEGAQRVESDSSLRASSFVLCVSVVNASFHIFNFKLAHYCPFGLIDGLNREKIVSPLWPTSRVTACA